METTARVGRNEPCPCGSGKKYKACCEGKIEAVAETKPTPYRFIGVTVVVLGLVGVVALRFVGNDEPAAKTSSTNTIPPVVLPPPPMSAVTTSSATAQPQPPGPVPAGKVWSADHGHWHDAPGAVSSNAPVPVVLDPTGAALPSAVTPPAASFTPQPAGPVPEGKVWSTDHGHWHDAPAGSVPPQQ